MERSTRNKKAQLGLMDQMNENVVPRVHGIKRAGEGTTLTKDIAKKTRKAFGDITNRGNSQIVGGKSKVPSKSKVSTTTKTKTQLVAIPHTATGSLTNSQQDRSDTSWDLVELSQPDSQSSQESCNSSNSSEKRLEVSVDELTIKDTEENSLPEYEDIDKNENDLYFVSDYVHSIFEYQKIRERQMAITDYMVDQKDLTTSMRAVLVDWLVEVQENFELNHETLYLAVKMLDRFLMANKMTRDRLQLVGSTAMFIACKFDERMPPVLDDFIYICDDAYTRDHLLTMERELLRSIGFDLGFPLSYSFLRRFGKCGHTSMDTLTLARYVLEMSLMDYSFVTERDSKMAAASLLLARAMFDSDDETAWNMTLEHYSGYSRSDLLPMAVQLNAMISATPSKALQTIRTKYSHSVFHEVALMTPLTTERLAALDL